MFYFAAASFSEMARRVESPDRPRRFLCADHQSFGEATLRLSPARIAGAGGPDGRAGGPQGPPARGEAYAAAIAGAAEPLNIAGLCDPAKANWYGVDLGDAVRGASKLGVSAERIRGCV
jgi:FADH2 O2-dependent halogenase